MVEKASLLYSNPPHPRSIHRETKYHICAAYIPWNISTVSFLDYSAPLCAHRVSFFVQIKPSSFFNNTQSLLLNLRSESCSVTAPRRNHGATQTLVRFCDQRTFCNGSLPSISYFSGKIHSFRSSRPLSVSNQHIESQEIAMFSAHECFFYLPSFQNYSLYYAQRSCCILCFDLQC